MSASPTVTVPAYRPDEFAGLRSLAEQKAWLDRRGIANPYFRPHTGVAGAHTAIAGRTLLNFSSYNYLGFCGHPDVDAAAKAAIDRYGTSVSASRIVSGERPFHTDLEQALAAFLGTEEALVFVSGHGTNVTVIPDLVGPGDVIFHDSALHNSGLLGARLSGARRICFPHNSPERLEALLTAQRASGRRALILVEGVYSMDGDCCALPRFVELKQRFDAQLMVDEAHALGVLGAGGRGLAEHFGVAPAAVDLWMGTLSKTLASCGGFLAGSRALLERLRYYSPGFLYSVGLPPPAAASARAALALLGTHPERPARLRARADLFRTLARERGWSIGRSHDSAIVPLITGNSEQALRLSAALFADQLNVQPIVFPAVPHREARLRFFFSSEHTEADIRTAVDHIGAALARL